MSQFAHSGRSTGELLELALDSGDDRSIELARAYQDYTAELGRHRLMDREARLRFACELCEAGQQPPLGRPKQVVATGVDSLTPLELRFLTAILRGAETATMALSVDDAAGLERAQMQKTTTQALPEPCVGPSETVRRLFELFPGAVVEWLHEPDNAAGPQQHARERLFHNPREQAPVALEPGEERLRVHGAVSLSQEIEDAAAQVKRLLLGGAKPAEVVVASRRLGELGPRLKEALAEVGVPVAVEGGLTLGQAPVARTAALLLRLAAGDWRHDDLLSVVTSPRLGLFDAPLSAEGEWALCRKLGFAGRRAALEWVLRELLHPKGRRELLQRFDWLVRQWELRTDRVGELGEESEPFDRRRDRQAAAAWLVAAGLRKLSELTESLSVEATPLEWHDRLAGVLGELGYQSPTPTARAPQELDSPALAALEEAFVSLGRIHTWRGREDKGLPLAEVDRLLRGWLGRVRLEVPWRHEGVVRALSAETASELSMRHLLLIGLDEQSFPRPDNAVALQGDPARQRLHQSGEMLLFRKLITAASDTTTLSYAALDDKAQTLNPSSYVMELERLFTPGALRIAPTPSPEEQPLSPRIMRRQAVRRLLEGDAAVLGQLHASAGQAGVAQSLSAGLLITHQRSHGEGFGPAEGVLAGEGAQALMLARYGPTHLWSASQLEQYGTCPFKFYLRHVLHADPTESLTLDVDYRRRGSLLHDAMVHFHRRVDGLLKEGEAASSIDPEQFMAAFREAIDEACQALKTAPHEAAIAEVEAMQAVAWGESYRRQHEKYDEGSAGFDAPLRPAHFEARFGPTLSTGNPDETPDPLSTDEPFALSIGDEAILLTGQVDRIDVGRVGGQLVFSVIDYKTSKTMAVKQEDIESGRLLQLVLYTIAVADHLFAGQGVAPWRTGYWLIQDNGFKFNKKLDPGDQCEGQVVLGDAWTGLVEAVRGTVGRIVRDVRAARFPMFNTDDNCGGRCEYKTVCRVGLTRSMNKLPEGVIE